MDFAYIRKGLAMADAGYAVSFPSGDIEALFASHERLRAALKPFSDIADLVNHTEQRDGETVFRLPNPAGGYFTLIRADFTRASQALDIHQQTTQDAK